MPQIIALQGKARCGKTTTINLLPTILLANGYSQVPGMYKSHRVDFLDVFEKAGKRVGVTSSGRFYDLVHDRLNELITAGCDTCICACRTYDRVPPGTVAAVESFRGYTHHFVSKTMAAAPALEAACNERDAITIFGMI